jgi:hypothetical protein
LDLRGGALQPDQSSLDRFIERSVGLLPDSGYQASIVHSYRFAPEVAHLAHLAHLAERRDDAIVHVLPKQFSLPLETWITMHEDLRNSPRCRVTFDALVKGLQRHVG